MPSLQTRLGAGLFISLLFVFAGLWLLVSNATRYLAEGYLYSRLQHDAESLLIATQLDPAGQLFIDELRISSIYQKPFSGHYYYIAHGNNELRSRSLWDFSLTIDNSSGATQVRSRTPGPQDQELLVLVSNYSRNGENYTIAVAEDFTPIEQDISGFQKRFTLAAVFMLALLVLLQGVLLRTSLHPLKRVSDELRDLERGELSRLDENVPSEIAPMVREINHLFSVLVQRLERSRNSLGDLAHALKKPLTVLKQLTSAPGLEGQMELKQQLISQTDHIGHITDRILKRARLAGEGPGGTYFSLDRDLPDLIHTFKLLYKDKEIGLTVDKPGKSLIAIDRDDMLELLGNVLDNACKWSRKLVTLVIRCHKEQLLITVDDDGSGVDDDAIKDIPARGTRLDETVQGHGLGLAIVSDIVRQYGGTLEIAHSSAMTGLSVRLTLPLKLLS